MQNYTRGIDLKVERTALRLLQRDVAEQMGVPSSRISVIENQDRVTARTAERYRTALTTLATVPTPVTAA